MQVKQSSFIVLFLFLAVSSPAVAQDWRFGGNIDQQTFFDFGAAKANWLQLRDAQQFKAFRDAHCQLGGPYERWEKMFDANKEAALNALANDKEAEAIKRCHDLYLSAYKWDQLWSLWRAAPSKGKKWNALDEASKACDAIRRNNVFTGKCNDLPNWRDWRSRK